MQIQSKIPAFDDVFHLLVQADTQTTPSEIHGVLCGFICVGSRLNGKFWLDTLLKRLETFGTFAAEQQDLILSIYDAACRQLSGVEGEFRLLLPAATSSLTERAEALSEWCQGFLYGLSLAGNPIDTYVSEDVHEALRSITDIAKLNFDNIEIDEMDKTAYQNVSNYVESSIVMIYNELTDSLPSASNGSKPSQYLH